jgi:hypothetical protein
MCRRFGRLGALEPRRAGVSRDKSQLRQRRACARATKTEPHPASQASHHSPRPAGAIAWIGHLRAAGDSFAQCSQRGGGVSRRAGQRVEPHLTQRVNLGSPDFVALGAQNHPSARTRNAYGIDRLGPPRSDASLQSLASIASKEDERAASSRSICSNRGCWLHTSQRAAWSRRFSSGGTADVEHAARSGTPCLASSVRISPGAWRRYGAIRSRASGFARKAVSSGESDSRARASARASASRVGFPNRSAYGPSRPSKLSFASSRSRPPSLRRASVVNAASRSSPALRTAAIDRSSRFSESTSRLASWSRQCPFTSPQGYSRVRRSPRRSACLEGKSTDSRNRAHYPSFTSTGARAFSLRTSRSLSAPAAAPGEPGGTRPRPDEDAERDRRRREAGTGPPGASRGRSRPRDTNSRSVRGRRLGTARFGAPHAGR